MKKILSLVACLLTLGLGVANAQVYQGEMAAGAQLTYGTWSSSPGLGVRFQYAPWDHIRGSLEVDGFFKHDHKTCWDVNLNAHYVLNLWQERLRFYPLLGLNYTMTTHKWSERDPADEENHVGLNVGAGLEYGITDHLNAFFQYRHTIVRVVDQGIFAAGVTYRF